MADPRDTEIDIEPAWEEPTPKVVVAPPDDPYLRGALLVFNELFKYLQADAWRIQPEGLPPRPLTADEAATIVQELRRRVGV